MGVGVVVVLAERGMMGGDDGRQSQRLYQVSIGAALDLECNLSLFFFFTPPPAQLV